MARVVELRCFGGLTYSEIAEVLEVDERTAKRDWQVARAWLFGRLRKGSSDAGRGMEQIKTIFEAALNLAESDREAYLESACGSNAELRRTVSELLANHLEASEFLEDVAFPMRHVFGEGEVVAGRFRIARFISSGGMGEVYEAYDQKLRLRLALKTLRPEFAANPLHLEHFQREILVAREVAHESLCRVFDLIEHRPEGTDLVVPCLTMQLLDGETLVSYLKEHKPLAIDEALRLVRQIAGAIETLHDNGLIHRDLKPSNVMVVPEEGGACAPS